jgi:choline dehydrogenase-like flavoprotein
MLNRLVEANEATLIQDTSFTTDVLGRYLCNTWEEATNNGGLPFDAIVIGAGMFGAYCAEKIYREGRKDNLRVLVLEAGSFLVSEHVQNLARLGLNAAAPIKDDPGVARNAVWGLPWRSQEAFPGLAYCLGGRSLFWGGWAPRLTEADFANWPDEIANYFRLHYGNVEREIGVVPSTDFISGDLFTALMDAFQAKAPMVPTVDAIEEAPLAVQGDSPASGLFSFDKYSSAPILADAIREAASNPDSSRRLFLVPRAHVIKLHTQQGRVSTLEVAVNGQRKYLNIPASCAVVLANGTIESTRLAMESFPTPLMGRNLVGHLRSNTVVRIKRSVLPPSLPQDLEAAALFVRGSTPQGRYHIQVTAAAIVGANSEATMFRMIPDIDLQDEILTSQDADWIVMTLRGIGEMVGSKQANQPTTSWMDLSPYEPADEFGARRAWVNLVATQADHALWDAMDDAALGLAQKIALDDTNNIEYFYDGAWRKNPPTERTKVRDKLGSTHHEAGTLWMGTDPNTSVTNLNGRFHHISNAYVAGPAIFPALGSANPALSGLTLARRTAAAIVREVAPAVEDGFTALFNGTLDGWQMAGFGGFNIAGRNILQTEGGIGLLWYTPQEFSDFILKVDWRASSVEDNSGIFIRFPALGNTDPANDWQLPVTQGYEIQIDDRGFNPSTNTVGDPLHQTGAVYTLAPSTKIMSRPIGEWNTFEIEAKQQKITIKLNGELVSTYTNDGTRPLKGHIGIQNHHTGSLVQFRNIRIKELVTSTSSARNTSSSTVQVN